jgi:hypothetical protein
MRPGRFEIPVHSNLAVLRFLLPVVAAIQAVGSIGRQPDS